MGKIGLREGAKDDQCSLISETSYSKEAPGNFALERDQFPSLSNNVRKSSTVVNTTTTRDPITPTANMNSRTRKPVRINISQLRSAKVLHGLQTLSQQVRKEGVKISRSSSSYFVFAWERLKRKGLAPSSLVRATAQSITPRQVFTTSRNR